MSGIFTFAPAIAAVPLASFLLVLFAGNYLPKRGALPGIVATGVSLLLSLWVGVALLGGKTYHETLYTFVAGAGLGVELTLGILIDPLSALMLVVVSLIAVLVHIFSLGYMNDEGETGLPRYYAGLSLFSFSMLAFVFSDNLLMSFMFFELVGLCSYLLIGFWMREEGPASAAKKAFLVTRFGDYFFLVGTVAVLATFGTASFAGPDSFITMAEHAMPASEAAVPGVVADWLAFVGFSAQQWFTIVGLLVLGGVVGKSAQFPLHTWLPDAMEGPTPVSALIHAATMVAAGVYLVARMYGFYALSPTALGIIALIGGFTALFAATMGVVKQELKQVLAYSTISQYGYMLLALGGGGYVAAVFHLTTHAVFKALLFLAAGSVIIAMHHEENMWEMGGLKSKLRVTYLTFLSGSLALAGIFPFAGFWSKDEVLYEALVHGLGGETGGTTLLLLGYALGLIAVVFTAFYTVRMLLLTFHGDPRTDAAENPHAVGWTVKAPLGVLGVLAAVLGFANMGFLTNVVGESALLLHEWLNGAFLSGGEDALAGLSAGHYGTLLHDFAGYSASSLGPLVPGLVSLALALTGAGLAYALYSGSDPAPHTEKLGSIRTLLMNNYYQDEYQVWLARGVTVPLSRAADKFDQGIVDGIVNSAGSISLFAGDRMRRIQTGIVGNYATLLTLGLTLLLLAVGLAGGWF